MPDYEQSVFISYAWGGEREEIVNQLDLALQARGIKLVRDKRDLGYKGSIREFMERIGQGNCVVVVISDKYLRSPSCMFELAEIADGKQFRDRIFPVVLNDANIYDPIKRIEYIQYWEGKRAELASAIRTLDPANLQGIREDIDLYDRIRHNISGLTNILKDMNTLTPEIHQDSNFSVLYEALEKRMQQNDSAATESALAPPPVESLRPPYPTNQMMEVSKSSGHKRIFISYKRNVEPDASVALDVYEALRNEHEVFIDTTIQVGEKWAERIEQEIKSVDYLIVFLSENSTHSEMVIAEIETAHHHQKAYSKPAILPVRLAFSEALVYPLSVYLNPLQWAIWKKADDTSRLIHELRQAVSGGSLPLNYSQMNIVQAKPAEIFPTAFADVSLNLGSLEGTMPHESPLYIERDSDQEALEAISVKDGITITIKGPRQMGKSSLLNRVLAAGRSNGMQTAFIDFQMIEKATMQDRDLFYRQFCSLLSYEFDIEDMTEKFWSVPLGPVPKTTNYIRKHLLSSIPGKSLLLAMDEVERMFASPFQSDFFSMLRSWHNNRAIFPDWMRLNLALVTSTEPYQLITDLNQSPFNVGIVVELTDFSRVQVAELNKRYGTPLSSAELETLIALLGGHPYLTRKAIYLVATRRFTFDQLIMDATEDDGPFGDHLRNHLFRMADQKDLKEALVSVIQHHRCADEHAFFRLRGAGLIRRKGIEVLPRNQLYSDYFRKRINE